MLRKSLNSYRIFTSLPSTWNRTIIYNHYYPSVIYSTHRIQYQEYHSTSQLQKRNDGSSGGIEKIREFSKKQKRRHKLKLNEIKEKKKHDPLKQQKMEAMKTHMESPETKEFIKEAEESVLAAVREALLPDGLQSLLAEFDGFEEDDDDIVELQDIATRLLDQLDKNSSDSSEILIPVTAEEANAALVLAGKKGSKKSINSFLAAMEKLEIPVFATTMTTIMNYYIDLKEYTYVEALFEKSLDVGMNPTSDTWAALIKSKASAGDIDGAQSTMDRLVRIGVIPTTTMYVSILRAYLQAKKNDEAFEYWMRMKAEGATLNVEAYNLMLQHCIQTYNPERAFLYFDEMKGIGRNIQPDAESYAKLFEVCGHAPMWVNGYQDIIFDAMAIMEGAEYPPTTEIYNSIIKSFGQGGDSAAAEFYFWEMRQKNIPQTTETYNNLFGALACGQRVGYGPYMIKPRYVRPPEPESRNELHDLMLQVGAIKTNEIKSSSYTSDGIKERGKRQMHPSTADEDEMDDREITESFTGALRAASQVRGAINHAAELKARDEERKMLYETETGRTITLDLLAKGVNPGPGRVLHILPNPTEVIDEPSNEDIFSNSLNDNPDYDENALNELPDDDPEFERFMAAFKDSLGTDGFESMLEELDKKLDGQSNDNNPTLKDETINPFDNIDIDENEEIENERLRNAQELFSDTERGLVDIDKMDAPPPSSSQLSNFKEDMKNIKIKKSSNEVVKKNESFNFDSVDLGDPNLLSSSNLLPNLKKPKNPLLALLDNEPIEEEVHDTSSSSSSSSSYPITSVTRDANGVIPESEIDRQWNFILFARCPEPDYSKPLPERRKENIIRANGLYRDMLERNIPPDVNTLTSYMSVYSEAARLNESLDILDKFATNHDLLPNENTYYYLIRLHIFLKDIDGALQRLNEMKSRELIPNGKIYGTLIQSLTHRDKLVEALNLLEEAHHQNIHISNTFIKKLRNRCENLDVTHPYIPPDPNQWAKDVKEFRKKTKGKPIGSRVHAARSMSFV